MVTTTNTGGRVKFVVPTYERTPKEKWSCPYGSGMNCREEENLDRMLLESEDEISGSAILFLSVCAIAICYALFKIILGVFF